MNGGSIHDNTAGCHGGGIGSRGSATVNGGEIYNNIAKYDGGGVYTSSLTMNGGSIHDSTAGRYGGGVGHDSYLWTFKMYGGEIRDNYAGNSGGGVYAAASNTWNTVAHHWLVSGRITGNTAARNGGGVVLGQYPSITTGETRIYGVSAAAIRNIATTTSTLRAWNRLPSMTECSPQPPSNLSI